MTTYIAGKRLQRAEKFPLVMMLEPLHACNLTCTGCGRIREYAETIREKLTVEQCLKALEECGALPLGIMDDQRFQEKTIPLERGDLLLLYTDGITETRSPGQATSGTAARSHELFGVERLDQLLLACGGCGAGSCIFMHLWPRTRSVTSGCTALHRPDMLAIAQWLDPRREPCIVQLPAAEMARVEIKVGAQHP